MQAATSIINQKTQGINCSEAKSGSTDSTSSKNLCVLAKSELLYLAQTLPSGASLPTYADLADKLKCSVAPIKIAAKELCAEGIISLQRGRPARVLWNNSFSRSAKASGKTIITRAVELSFRPLRPTEQGIADEMGLKLDKGCIVCERIREINGLPTALQATYINPNFFAEPIMFFLLHDVINGSMSDVYSRLGFRPISIKATLKTGIADERELSLLRLPKTSPVLRSYQQTIVDKNGVPEVLEIMIASYTQNINYEVERLPRWACEESQHG